MGVFGQTDTRNRGNEDAQRFLASQFLYGRVVYIDQSNTLFNGQISVEIMEVKATLQGAQIVNASPLFPNIKNYPLKNETVFLITGPKNKYSQNPGGVAYTYN